ncbi:MAG: anaerobic ribonucleoside-triphosphate reductase activating protein [Chloroflexia bacterium]|nr:anaerobic ribonucleoside-triphosphate reductase activating protein [Chloroflexia bacterium]
MEIKGWQRTSLIDYPEHIATVFFTGGCNFRCPLCHNAGLVLQPDEFPSLSEAEVWDFLQRRAGLLDGVVLTGGEPTLQPDLLPFIRRLRSYDLAVKLDTNGYRPDVLQALLDEGLLDYVAMDVKAPPVKYALLAGRPNLDLSRIEGSIALLKASNVAYEFRTTVVPGLLDEEDIVQVAQWVTDAPLYALQQFRPQGTLDPALEQVSPYPTERMQSMAERAGRHVERVVLRGV